MNKKGFTLIELLASLVIVSLILTITITAIAKVVKSSKNDLSDVQLELIRKGAEDYIASNMSNVPVITSGEKIYYITLSELVDSGIIDNVKNSKGEKYTNNNLIIKVVITHSEKYKKNNSSVFVITDEDEIKNIKNNYTKLISRDIYCKSVNNDTKTTGNVPTGSYIPGDEYICEVETGKQYHFFIISTEENNVNLIMDRNIDSAGNYSTKNNPGYSLWFEEGSNVLSGPGAAFDFLYLATKSWNIPNISINYSKYSKITTVNDITNIVSESGEISRSYNNLKARMITLEESENLGCSSTSGTCPLFLANYLSNTTDTYTNGTNFDTELTGYWTMTGMVMQIPAFAFEIGNKGSVSYVAANSTSKIGIRPVISIPKSNLE